MYREAYNCLRLSLSLSCLVAHTHACAQAWQRTRWPRTFSSGQFAPSNISWNICPALALKFRALCVRSFATRVFDYYSRFGNAKYFGNMLNEDMPSAPSHTKVLPEPTPCAPTRRIIRHSHLLSLSRRGLQHYAAAVCLRGTTLCCGQLWCRAVP